MVTGGVGKIHSENMAEWSMARGFERMDRLIELEWQLERFGGGMVGSESESEHSLDRTAVVKAWWRRAAGAYRTDASKEDVLAPWLDIHVASTLSRRVESLVGVLIDGKSRVAGFLENGGTQMDERPMLRRVRATTFEDCPCRLGCLYEM